MGCLRLQFERKCRQAEDQTFGVFQFLVMTIVIYVCAVSLHEERRSSRPTDAEVCVPLI